MRNRKRSNRRTKKARQARCGKGRKKRIRQGFSSVIGTYIFYKGVLNVSHQKSSK
jgi:hypothetical protein